MKTGQMTRKQSDFLSKKLSAEVSSRKFALKKDKVSLQRKKQLVLGKKQKLSKKLTASLKKEIGKKQIKTTDSSEKSRKAGIFAGQLRLEQKNLQKGHLSLRGLKKDLKVKQQKVNLSAKLLSAAEKKIDKLENLKAVSEQVQLDAALSNQEQELVELKISQKREGLDYATPRSESSNFVPSSENVVASSDLQVVNRLSDSHFSPHRIDYAEGFEKKSSASSSLSDAQSSGQKESPFQRQLDAESNTQSVDIDYRTEDGKSYNLRFEQSSDSSLAVRIESMDGVTWTEHASSQLRKYLSAAGYRNVKVEFASNA